MVCGDFLCFKLPSETSITVIKISDIQDMADFNNYPIHLDVLHKYALIDLKMLINMQMVGVEGDDCDGQLVVTLKPASSLYALHSYPDNKFDEEILMRRSNQLQVTVKSRGIFYDLSKPKPDDPILIKVINEIPAMHHLLDCQKYVETGVKMNKIKNRRSEKHNVCYQLSQEIKSNFTGSFYFLKCTQTRGNSTSDKRELKQVECHSPFMGGYRSFCELDLIEVRRIKNLIE